MTARLVLLRHDPDILLERIAELAGGQRSFRLAVMGAGALHVVVASYLADVRAPSRDSVWRPPAELTMIELPPPEMPKEMPREEPPPPVPTPVATRQKPAPAEAAQAPAQAAAPPVLTQADDSEQPVDLTNTIVSGTATSFAGGVTGVRGRESSTFASGAAIRAANPSPGAPTTARGDVGPDLSRQPSVLGGMAWDCPFPAAADVDGVNQALTTIRVEVDATGRVTRVHVLKDPGHGFGDAARRCATSKRWGPALDRQGRAVAGGINVSVRFLR